MTLTGIEKKLGVFSLCVEKLEVPGPGIYGVIGPNGSGKSTLAKLIAGLIDTDRGLIDTAGLGPRDITFIPRKPYMMDDTVYNNLVYPLRLRKIKPDPALIDEYLDKMRFSDRAKQKARSLSGGEQQKLSLLRALIFRPRLIIADEAMTALDIDSLDLFENLILDEQKKDPIIWIIISHQMTHVRRLADVVFFMYQGRIEASGSVAEILSHRSNRHLGQYLRVYGGGIPETENGGSPK
jgi:ABC-type multidrug transport system ATPase subunit